MIFIILKFKNLNRSIIFSICFIYIFNLSSVVYANHKNKDEKIIGVGTLVSVGLGALAKAEVVAVLCAVGLRLGMDMNSTTQSALDKFIEDNPDLINSENFGKSENGLIAVSKNVIDKFTTFLKDMFEDKPDGTLINDSNKIKFYLTDYTQSSSLWGYKYGPFPEDTYHGSFPSSNPSVVILKKGQYVILEGRTDSWISAFLVAQVYNPDGSKASNYPSSFWDNYGNGGIITHSELYDYGTYVPQNQLKDDLGNTYTGDKDFILNPSWDIGSNTGVLEGFPALPWSEDKTFGSTGSIGVLNPDGTITDSPSVPDVENPDIPNVDTNEQTGILGWLSKFWENLWEFFMELVKALFYPTSAIDTWNTLKNTTFDRFKFLSQLEQIKWSTNNNSRLRIPFNYGSKTYIIELPDYFEDNYVTYFRNIFKYFVYALTLFICVRILRPKFTIGTR